MVTAIVVGAIAAGVAFPLAIPRPVVTPWAGRGVLAAIAARTSAEVAALGLGPATDIVVTSATAATASRSAFTATIMATATLRAASIIASVPCTRGVVIGGAAIATASNTKYGLHPPGRSDA